MTEHWALNGIRLTKIFFRLSSFTVARSLISTLSNEMEISENGLLKKMKMRNLSENDIVRLFSDLLIAAGDTVSWF